MKKRKEKLKGYPVLIVLIVFCFCGLLLGIKFRLNESNWYLYVKEKIVLTNNKIRDLFVNLLCFKNIYTLEEENDLLKEEILKLKLESNNFKMLEEEINFIKSNLNLEKLDNVYDILSAKVIDRDSNWYNSITINKGKDDGIKVDFMVL